MKQKNSDIHFITFSTFKYRPSAIFIIIEAILTKWFKSTKIYGPNDLKKINRAYLTKGQNKERGYGCWFWKPMIIYESLLRIKDGDILVYLDAGFTINAKGHERFKEYIEKLNKSDAGVVVFELSECKLNDINLLAHKKSLRDLLEVQYTKKSVIEYFNLEKDDIFSPQIQGAPIIIKRNIKSLRLIREWYEHANPKNRMFTNPDINELQNIEFLAHRNDQSVLSCLLKSNQITPSYSAYETWVSTVSDDEVKKAKEMRRILIKYPFICLRRKIKLSNFIGYLKESFMNR